MIRFQRVCKSFGDVMVLHELDLEIAASEKVALIGPSGSGKSTILRILMTLEEIDAGRVELDGETLWEPGTPGGGTGRRERARLRRLRGKVGMVFQHFHLFPHKTVLENLELAPRRVAGLGRKEAEAVAIELLRSVGLEDKAGAYPAQLSGGQKQRVAIARALALRPRVMLFDEVTSALDPELVGEVLNVLRELARTGEMTMLIVTHQMNFAREIADRVVFLEGGRVVEQGDPEQLLREPAHERTRAFLRSILRA